MTQYKYTAEVPLIFSDLSHGINAIVHRANPELDEAGDEIEAPEGSTVVLHPGDTVDIPDGVQILSAHLEDVTPAPKKTKSATPAGNTDESQTAASTEGN